MCVYECACVFLFICLSVDLSNDVKPPLQWLALHFFLSFIWTSSPSIMKQIGRAWTHTKLNMQTSLVKWLKRHSKRCLSHPLIHYIWASLDPWLHIYKSNTGVCVWFPTELHLPLSSPHQTEEGQSSSGKVCRSPHGHSVGFGLFLSYWPKTTTTPLGFSILTSPEKWLEPTLIKKIERSL